MSVPGSSNTAASDRLKVLDVNEAPWRHADIFDTMHAPGHACVVADRAAASRVDGQGVTHEWLRNGICCAPLFDRAAPHLQVTSVRVLTTDNELVGEAAQVLGISPFDLKTVG